MSTRWRRWSFPHGNGEAMPLSSSRRNRCGCSSTVPRRSGRTSRSPRRTRSAVAEIVERLDGLPLALELAASRLRVLDPTTLAERLEDRLSMLRGGDRDLPERHRTLEGTIRWSYEMLEPDERRLFARLSVFAGGWTLDAAEGVCGGGGIDVLEGLGTLVDDSLVRRRELANGTLRFFMLETIREFAGERLEEAGKPGYCASSTVDTTSPSQSVSASHSKAGGAIGWSYWTRSRRISEPPCHGSTNDPTTRACRQSQARSATTGWIEVSSVRCELGSRGPSSRAPRAATTHWH